MKESKGALCGAPIHVERRLAWRRNKVDAMNGQPDQDRQVTRQGRVVAIVIAVTTIAWLAIQWAGSQFGWNARYVFLADFAALAAFFWALVVAAQIWRKRRNDET